MRKSGLSGYPVFDKLWYPSCLEDLRKPSVRRMYLVCPILFVLVGVVGEYASAIDMDNFVIGIVKRLEYLVVQSVYQDLHDPESQQLVGCDVHLIHLRREPWAASDWAQLKASAIRSRVVVSIEENRAHEVVIPICPADIVNQ